MPFPVPFPVCNHAAFRRWFSAVRYSRNHIGDSSPLGPFFGIWELTSAAPDQSGLQRRTGKRVRVAAYRAHAFDMARHGLPIAGTGKHYRRLNIEAARRSRELFDIPARLPR